MDPENQHHMLDEIDRRQDDVIRQLEELNERVVRLLGEFQKPPRPPAAA